MRSLRLTIFHCRSNKSHLLKSGVRRESIVEIALDRKKDARLRDPDALYDFLTEIGEPTEATFEHSEDMVEALAPYGLKLLQTLIEASIKNPNFKLKIAWSED